MLAPREPGVVVAHRGIRESRHSGRSTGVLYRRPDDVLLWMWLGQSDGVIVVVEGPSASGKTTWLKRHVAPEQTIPEHGGIEVPAGHDDEVKLDSVMATGRRTKQSSSEARHGGLSLTSA